MLLSHFLRVLSADLVARFGRLDLPDDPPELVQPRGAELTRGEGEPAGEDLVEHHPERVHVGPGIDVLPAEVRLLRAHVLGRSDDGADLGEEGLLGEPLSERLGNPEVDDLRLCLSIEESDQDVGGLEISMDDGLLVGVLHALAHLDEEVDALGSVELVSVTVLGDPDARDVLHDEVRPTVVGGTALEHLRDRRVIHQCQGLPLGLEASHDLLGVHARLDDLERDPPAHRLGLLDQPHLAHPALSEQLEDTVGADDRGMTRNRPHRQGVLERVGHGRLPVSSPDEH